MLAIRSERTGHFGTLILISSPNGCRGKFWESFNSPLFSRMQIPSFKNKYISQEWLDEQKQLMPSNIYQQEILAQFVEIANNFFTSALVEKCSKLYDFVHFPEPGKKYFFGIDIGRVKDCSVICICSIDFDKIVKVENIVEMENKPFSVQIQHIKLLQQQYHPVRITIEKAGLSLPVVEQLREMNLPIKEFVPTTDNKAEAYNNLLKEMEQGKIILPASHQRLQYQLKTFQYEITPQGKMKLHHASELEGDDYCDALAFALWGEHNHTPLISNIGLRTLKEYKPVPGEPIVLSVDTTTKEPIIWDVEMKPFGKIRH